MTGLRGRAAERAAITVVFLALVAAGAAWLAADRHPPEWDYASHLENALHCRRDLGSGDLAGVFGRSSFYPPIVSCVAGLVYGVLPSDVAYGEVVMFAFLGLGMAATYLLARPSAGGWGAVVAAVLFGTAPVVFQHALHFQLDVPLAAMVATFLVLVRSTDHFERRGRTILAGLIFGLGMLTKPPFFLFVAAPGLLILARTRGRRAWGHACLGGLVALLVALPWYGPRLFGLATQIQNRSFKQAAEAGAPEALSAVSLAYYPLSFPVELGVVAVLLLLVGIGVALRRRCWDVLAGLVPLVVLFLLQNKQMRYALPLVPMLAVAGGLGFAALPAAGRRVTGVALGVAAMFQVSATVLSLPWLDQIPVLGALRPAPALASAADWQQRAIFDAIVRDGGDRPHTVSVAVNSQYFSPANFRYLALRDGRRLRIARAWEGEPIGIDYMILKTGDLGPSFSIDKPQRVRERLTSDPALARVFPVIGEFPLPDGSRASVRARRLPTDLETTPDALARSVAGGLRARLAEVMRDVEGLDVRLDYDASILRGHVKRVEITVASATVGELRKPRSALLRLHDLRVRIDDALVNPWSAAQAGRFDPLDAGGITIERATIDAADLREFLTQVKGMRGTSLALGAGFVDLTFRALGPDVGARVQVVAATDRPFALRAERVTVGGVPIPALLVNWIMSSVDPSRSLAGKLPFPATIRPVTVTQGAIRIGP